MQLNNSKKSKILLYIIAAFLLAALIFSMVVPAGSLNTYADEGVPTVSITEVSTTSSSYVRKVNVSIANAQSGVTYTVYVRTQNGSAVAGTHFESFSEEITLTSSNSSVTKEITLVDPSKKSGYDVNYDIERYSIGTSYTSSGGYTVSSTKKFICEIYYAESTSSTIYDSSSTDTDGTVVISSTKGSVELSYVPGSTSLPMTTINKNYYFKHNQWVQSSNYFKWSNVNTNYHSGSSGYSSDNISSGTTISTGGMTNYYNTGWACNSYSVFGYVTVPKDYYTYYVNIAGNSRYMYFPVTIDEDAWSGNTFSALYYLKSYNSSNGYAVVGDKIADTSGNGVSLNSIDQYNVNAIGTMLTSGNNYASNIYDKAAVKVDIAYDQIFMAWHKSDGSYTFKSNSIKIYNSSIYYTYYDNAGPQVVGYYVQDCNYGAGQTIRLSVRFNELVRLRKYKTSSTSCTPYIKFTTTEGTELKFTFAGGEGTDTLYFETTVPTGSSINLSDLKNCKSTTMQNFINVIDFSYNSDEDSSIVQGNHLTDTAADAQTLKSSNSSIYNASTTALTINTASTEVSVDYDNSYFIDYNGSKTDYTSTSNDIYAVSLTLLLTNVADGDTVYYCWIEGRNATVPTVKASYSSTVASKLTGASTASATISTIDSNNTVIDDIKTGEYTLCIMYVNAGFAKSYQRFNFSFDLEPPSVTLTAGSNYNVNNSSQSFTVEVADSNDITTVEYALSTSPTADEDDLIFVTLTDNAAKSSYSETVTINADLLEQIFDEEYEELYADNANYFYVYVRAADEYYIYDVTLSDFSLAVDLRTSDSIASQFSTQLYSTAGSSASNDEFYDKTLGTSYLTNQLKNVFYLAAGFSWYSVGVAWSYSLTYYSSDNSYSASGETDGTNTISKSESWYSITSYSSSGGMYYVVNFTADGWYTLTIEYTPDEGDPVSHTQEVYIYGNSGTNTAENYESLSGEKRYLITKYWETQKAFYYTYNDTTSPNSVNTNYFNSSKTKLVFSTYQEAYNYVYALEEDDVETVVIDSDTLDRYNRGSIITYDNVTMTVGSTWYRYKAASWSSMSYTTYGYYYYTGTTSNLAKALQSNTEYIVGTESANSYKYISHTQNASSDAGSLSLSTTRTGSRSSMYSSTVEYNGVTMYLASQYTVSYSSGTKLYWRKYGSSNDLGLLSSGVDLCDQLDEGAYEFYEIGKSGVVCYYVYVDKTAPTLNVTITDGSGGLSYVSDYSGSGSPILYGKSFTITSVADYDEWAVVEVYLSDSAVLQMTVSEFAEYTFTTTGTYYIYVYDRSGSQTSLTIQIKSTDLTVSYSSASSSTYTFTANRVKGELSALEVRYNGTVQTVDGDDTNLESTPYAITFNFYLSGTYSITMKDIYGYTYSESITLEKELPDVTILVLVNGTYVDITQYPNYYTVSDDGTTYTILTPAALYLRWDTSDRYALTWVIEPDAGDYDYRTTTGFNTYTIYAIAESTSGWMARIGYAKDSAASITIISLTDETAPTLTVSDGEGDLSDGDKTSSTAVTLYWFEDESAIDSIVYTLEGVTYAVNFTDTTEGTYELNNLAEGVYTVTVTNVLGLESTLTFTVDTSIDLYIYTSDGITEYEESTTIYENEDVKILLTDDFYFVIDSSLYENTLQVIYSSGGIAFTFTGNDDDVYEFTEDDLAAVADGGIFYGDSNGYAEYFLSQYGIYIGKLDDGTLYLGITKLVSAGENIYTVYAQESDSGADATLQVIICTDESEPVIRFASTEENIEYSAQDEVVTFDSNGSYMYNKPVYIYLDEQDYANVVSVTYSFDDGGLVTLYTKENGIPEGIDHLVVFADEGTYTVYVTNIYGTVSERTVRIYDSIILNAYVIYDDGTTLEINSDNSSTDTVTIYSNGSIVFEGVSRTTYAVYDNNGNLLSEFVFELNAEATMYVLTISIQSEYSFVIQDEYGNSKAFTIVITAPEEIELTDKETAFSGWDEDALRADDLFTDEMVTLNSSFISSNNITYITYEYYEGITSDSVLTAATAYGVLLDKITGSAIDETQTLIGSLGDGLYVIRMYDYRGNLVTYSSATYTLSYIAISYNGTSQINFYRLLSDAEEEESYSIELALSSGFYSNGSLIFDISATEYVFTVNGEEVTLTGGRYTISAEVDATYETYTMTYCDEFGNKMSFNAYIYTQKPQIEYADSDILVTVDSVTYAVGNPVLTSDGIGVTAYYYKDGSKTATDYTIGEEIVGDGEYLLYFVDIAGNVSAVNFVIDTEVSWQLVLGSISSYEKIFSGAVTSSDVRLMRSGSESLVLVSVTLNGEDVTSQYSSESAISFVFSGDGEYEVVVGDVVGNSETVTFTIISNPVQTFTYTLPSGYVLTSLAYTESGLNVYVKSGENITSDGVYLNGDHTWVVVITNSATAEEYTFSVETDNTTPEATLDGYAEVTKEAITIKSVTENGTVKVYKDGDLVSTTEVSAGKTLSIECSDYGSYVVVVTDLAGNSAQYEFTIQYTMDEFTIAFIVIVALLAVVLVFVIIRIRRTARIR